MTDPQAVREAEAACRQMVKDGVWGYLQISTLLTALSEERQRAEAAEKLAAKYKNGWLKAQSHKIKALKRLEAAERDAKVLRRIEAALRSHKYWCGCGCIPTRRWIAEARESE